MKKFSLAFVCLFLLNSIAHATIRVEVDGRDKEDVLNKSLTLGKTLEPAKITAIITDSKSEISSAVILDPYTVLSVAHSKFLKSSEELTFILSPEPFNQSLKHLFKAKLKTEPHIHTLYKTRQVKDDHIFLVDGKVTYKKIQQNDFHSKTFLDLQDIPLPFTGVDLSIFKLEKSLPQDLPYPEFYPNIGIDNAYGISIGFGPMNFNDQTSGPTKVIQNYGLSQMIRRHVISTKVSSGNFGETCYLYGDYTGLAKLGDESFIPNKDMMKTEGLPVNGDSGGGFFIKHEGIYKLAGIFSATYSINPNNFSQHELGEALWNLCLKTTPSKI